MENKFSATEVAAFRRDLMNGGLDWFQTAEVIRVFIVQHGYGVSTETALEAALRIDVKGCSMDCLRSELERAALVM